MNKVYCKCKNPETKLPENMMYGSFIGSYTVVKCFRCHCWLKKSVERYNRVIIVRRARALASLRKALYENKHND